ncbi:hypothetical protein EDC04DRAFT_2614644 [Pisolithus marmoratus]|nr:hypothetical protein EDC04DRAFT_2614644 [Pisolithus marmoratus]
MNMKELLFSLSNLNYIEFFQAILHKHGLEDYMVTERKHFPLNYIPPLEAWPSNYREMVKKISEYEGKLSIVKKLPQTSKSKGSGSSEDDELEPASDSAKSRKADLDSHLARWHLKLHRPYKNENDEGLTYIGPQGPIPDACHGP